MSSTSTTWTADALTKATNSTSTDDSLSIDGTLTVGGASTTTGLLTATAGIKLSNNIIYASDGGSTITLDTDDNVTIAGDLTVSGVYKGYMPWIHQASFYDNATEPVFLPLGSTVSEDDDPDADIVQHRLLMPYAGYLEKIVFRTYNIADTCDFEIYKAVAGTDSVDADQNKLSSTVSVESDTADTSVTVTFGTNYSFAVGDVMAIKMTYETAPIAVDLSIVWKVLIT